MENKTQMSRTMPNESKDNLRENSDKVFALKRRLNSGKKMEIRFGKILNRTRLNHLAVLLLLLTGLFQLSFAQAIRQTQNKADQTLRSSGRVNPSTLGMELSIPLTEFPGRAGNGQPLTLEYSSKVWSTRQPDTWETQIGTPVTDLRPRFAKGSVRGWTTSLQIPRIEFPNDIYGKPVGEPEGQLVVPNGSTTLEYVKRVKIMMADGSAHEMRQDDTVYDCGQTTSCSPDFNGTYLSVDGSKMRLDISSSQGVLYFPDGGRMFFDGNYVVTSLVDRNGNQMTYDASNKQWTDTLGRVLTNPLPGSETEIGAYNPTEGTQVYQFPGFNGQNQQVEFVWAKLSTQQTSPAYLTGRYCLSFQDKNLPAGSTILFPVAGVPTNACDPSTTAFDPVVLTEVHLQNGSAYKFHYNLYGEIDKIEYPSGGYERFEYATITPLQSAGDGGYDQFNRGVTKRWVSSDGTAATEMLTQFEVTRVNQELPTDYYKIKTTAPDNTYTESFLFDQDSDLQSPYGFTNIALGYPYDERSYSATGQLLRRKLTKYDKTGAQSGGYSLASRGLRPVKEVMLTFEPNASSALASMSETVYDTNSDAQYFASLNPKQTKTYHYVAADLTTAQTGNIDTLAALFSASNLANMSETDYLYDANYKARNIVTLPVETRVKDASGNVVAKSQIAYDEGSYGIISAGTDTMWTDPNTGHRANPTTARSWTDVGANQYIETHAQFDNFGNLRKSWDAKGNVSETEYASIYKYAYPTKVITPVPDSTGANGSSTAFETTSVYDLNTGLPTSTTDANGQMTQMEYNDSLLRPTKVIPPSAGGQTVMEYTDTPNAVSVKTKTQIDSTSWAESTVYADGLGRVVKSEKKDAQSNVIVQKIYDNMGRIWKITNPYRQGENPNWNETIYDDLGREKEFTTPDGAKFTAQYELAIEGNQIGETVVNTDQTGKKRRSITNVLDEISRVDEPNASGDLGSINNPSQSTIYTYDTLGNLIQISKGQQTRNFVYDALSRLVSATNPESGSVTQKYDANGNLIEKKDARNVVTTLSYDRLNRLILKDYSDTTPDVNFYYDNPSAPNSKGQLTKLSSSISTTDYTNFSSIGKVLNSQQIIGGQNYPISYSYNLLGTLKEQTYPSGRVVKNVLDADADITSVDSKVGGGSTFKNYASDFAFAPTGGVSQIKLGNNKWESTTFNDRLQVSQIALGNSQNGAEVFKVNYDYGTTDNNGNVKSQTITIPTIGTSQGFTASQTYAYDSLNRLQTATETVFGSQTWKQGFTYDQYDNRRFNAGVTTTLPQNCPAQVCNPDIDQSNNRIAANQGYEYDSAGNETKDAKNRQVTFDADNKTVEVRNVTTNALIAQYFYDGNGQRVKKIVGSETTIFINDAYGRAISEYSDSTQISTTPTTKYLTYDVLGSARVITDDAGQVLARRDFMPFGEEIAAGIGNRTLNQKYSNEGQFKNKFTGQLRDDEAEQDYFNARNYSYNLGRFTSADNFGGRISNPQTLNLYSYSLNNPLKWVDPTGHSAQMPGDDDPPPCSTYTGEGPCKGSPDKIGDEDETIVGPSSKGSDIVRGQDLPSSGNDWLPVYGNLRRLVWNMKSNGGNSINRALYYFGATAVDAYATGTGARGIYTAVKAAPRLFTKQAMAETLSAGKNAWNYVRNAARRVVGGGADEAAELANCFVAGTLIHTVTGLVPIEEVKAGDKVLSYDADIGKTEYRDVVRTFVNTTENLLQIKVSGEAEAITTTLGHPFFVNNDWVLAKLLKVGDELRKPNGEKVKILSIEKLEKGVTTYNFEVEKNHNYFVGQNGILVHNQSIKVSELNPLHSPQTSGVRTELQKLSDSELLESVRNPINRDPMRISTDSGKVVDGNGRAYELLRRMNNPSSIITPETRIPYVPHTPTKFPF